MSELSVGSLSGLAANSYVIDVASGSSLDLSNGATLPAGSIIQVVSTTKTDTFSLSSASFTEITGLTASITPQSTNSKILVLVSLNGDGSSADIPMIRLRRDSVNRGIGDTTGSRVSATTIVGTFQANRPSASSINFLDSPNTTSSITYNMTARINSGTLYINRSSSDTDAVSHPRLSSTITLMEVAG